MDKLQHLLFFIFSLSLLYFTLFSLSPLRERVRVRGYSFSPSPSSSPIQGEEIIKLKEGEGEQKFTDLFIYCII
jgi:hypothetical protein